MKYIILFVFIIGSCYAQNCCFNQTDSSKIEIGWINENERVLFNKAYATPITYHRNWEEYEDWINVGDSIYTLDILLDFERMEFYTTDFEDLNLVLIFSPDFSTSGYLYTMYRHVIIFEIKNDDLKYSKLVYKNFIKATDVNSILCHILMEKMQP